MRNRAADKRFLAAIGISLAIHLAGIIMLGFWSLKTPAVPERTPPLAVYLEPVVVPEPVIKKPEKLSSAAPPAEKKVNPSRKKPEPASQGASGKVSPPITKAISKAVPQPVPKAVSRSVPGSVAQGPSSAAAEPGAVQGPDSNLKLSPESTEPMTAVKPKSPLKPKGSKIVYADTPAPEPTDKTAPAPVKPESSVISSEDLNALVSSIKTADVSPKEQSATEVPENTAGQTAVTLPDTVSLDLGDSSNTRKPVSRLALHIPEEILREIGHDSFVTARFTLTPDGHILNPEVIDSQVSPQIEARVLEALRKWEFNRGSSTDGNVEGQITIRFKVK